MYRIFLPIMRTFFPILKIVNLGCALSASKTRQISVSPLFYKETYFWQEKSCTYTVSERVSRIISKSCTSEDEESDDGSDTSEEEHDDDNSCCLSNDE